MKYEKFSDLFYSICEIKIYVVKLRGKELEDYKKFFYNLNFPKWRLDLLWEFIWSDKTLDEITRIFKSKKLI